MKTVTETKRFSRDFKRTIRRGKNHEKLLSAVELLAAGEDLPDRMRPHKLSGSLEGIWECHLEPDWLLLYDVTDEEVILFRTGSHSDLFR